MQRKTIQPKQSPKTVPLLKRESRIKLINLPRSLKNLKRQRQLPKKILKMTTIQKKRTSHLISSTVSSRKLKLLINSRSKLKLTTLKKKLKLSRSQLPRLKISHQVRSNLEEESPNLEEVLTKLSLEPALAKVLMTLMKMAMMIRESKDQLRKILDQVEDANSLICLHLSKLEIIMKRTKWSPDLLQSSQPSVEKQT